MEPPHHCPDSSPHSSRNGTARNSGLSSHDGPPQLQDAEKGGDALKSAAKSSEPIAIIGMACRFPGADSPEELWELLESGGCPVKQIPPDRWDIEEFYAPAPAVRGKMFTRAAAFLDNVDLFDAHFFGISPREANLMDPQQRLVLEVSWEALENAGLAPDRMEGSDTGVYCGITGTDYWFLQVPFIEEFTGHASLGTVHCIAAGRLSYFYDFHGPNVAIDTACSSSLASVHLACQSLRNMECDAALAGGVNVISAPHHSVALCQLGAVAPDGHCKPFSAAADGFGRGEGCGFVVLKRLSDAVAAGDNVLAVIRGTAMTQDGRGTRLSAPNIQAQMEVYRKALADAAVDGSRVTFIETHGTGTAIGDPMEVQALTAVYGAPRPDGVGCALGSLKANVNHLETAAGVAGLIKTVLSLQNNKIPRQIHIDELNPAISFDGSRLFVPLETTDWPRTDTPRMAGVCSYGLSGTNVHVILEDPPAHPPALVKRLGAGGPGPYLLPVSARSSAALQDQISALGGFMSGDAGKSHATADICYTASARRSHHPYRAAVVGSTNDELADRLRSLPAKALSARAVVGGLSERVAFMFTGQGSQWLGMGRDLMRDEPVFRSAVERCDTLLGKLTGWSVIERLAAGEQDSRLKDTEVAQPTIFAVQVGLLALYDSWACKPDAVVGHSSGEVAAAYCSGALSLEDAVSVIYHRSRLMQRATGQGRMAAVGLTEADAQEAIAPYGGRLEVAAVNAPGLTVIAGQTEALLEVLTELRGRRLFCKDLGVDYAFHSRQMDPFLEELRSSLSGIHPMATTVELISSVTGGEVPGEDVDGAYWVRNVREQVRFADAANKLIGDGFNVFLEVGPNPALATPLSQCLKAAGAEGTIVTSLRSGQPGKMSLLNAASALFVAGCEIELSALHPDGGRPIALPNYAWQRRRYWLTQLPSFTAAAPAADSIQQAKEVISSFYDKVAESAETDGSFGHLTFVPFPEVVPGFSWLVSQFEHKDHPEWAEMVKKAHIQYRQVIFKGIDFSSIRSVLDFGCGYSTDLRNLAADHPHLLCDGYTLSGRQAELGNQKALAAGLADRVRIYQRDSGQEAFPGRYDLVIGFEVAHYIRDKHSLFSNIDRHLNDGGFVVLADFISNTVSEIRHEPTNSFFPTVDGWADILATYKLRVHDCVDASKETGNWLYDPNSKKNLKGLVERIGNEGELAEHMASYDGLGGLFRKKLATYAMLTIQKDRFQTHGEIARINREKLGNPTPYAEVVERMGLESVLAGHRAIDPLGDAAGWLFDVTWRPVPLPVEGHKNGTPAISGTWLIFSDDKGVGEVAASLLQARGDTTLLVTAGKEYRPPQKGCCTVNPSSPEDFKRLVAEVSGADLRVCRGIVHLWGLNVRPPQRTTLHSLREDEAIGAGSLLYLAQAMTSVSWEEAPKLWIGTRGVQVIDPGGSVSVAAGSIWGLGKTVGTENPRLWGGLVDLDPASSPRICAQQLVGEMVVSQSEDQIAWRGNTRMVARLTRRKDQLPSDKPVLDPEATYLITGGLGGLGLKVARWMVGEGVRNLVMLQRSALPARSTWQQLDPASREGKLVSAIRDLESTGATVRTYEVDVSVEEGVSRVLAEVRRDMPALKGIVHAAGMTEAMALSELDMERLRKLTSPKIDGAWNLHRLTLSDPLDFFVMFSSAASVVVTPLFGSYAAANAGLDTLAHYRHSEELPALSINWGPWSEVGMAAGQEALANRTAQAGLGTISPEQGITVLSHLLGQQDQPQVAVLAVDLQTLAASSIRAARSPLLSELSGQPVAAPQPVLRQPNAPSVALLAPERESAGIRQQLLVAEQDSRQGILEEYLRNRCAQVLELPPAEIELRQPLNRMGIDSLMAVELRNHVEGDLKIVVELVAFLEGASLSALAADLLRDQLKAGTDGPDDRFTKAFEQVAQMSDEAVEALLAEKRRQLSG
ncbi:MAG: type I polyketide synthase [Actinomycetota bacterium]